MIKLKNKKQNSGFTIVELLIVIVIIAILATLTIVAYNGIQKKAGDSAIRSDISQAAKQLAILEATNGNFPDNTDTLKKSNGTTYQYTYDSATKSYCLTVSNQWSEYHITNTNTTPQDGVCDGHTSQIGSGGGGGPAPPTISTDWSVIAIGGNTSCGLYLGTAYCWGANDWGQIGDGTGTTRGLPTAINTSGVLSGKTITDISVGSYNVCVRTTENKMYCSGMGARGQLGNGSTADTSVMVAPTMTGALSGKTITKISLQSQSTCAIASDSKAYCWGLGSSGEIGNNATTVNITTPTAVTNTGVLSGKTLIDISSGYTGACVLDSTGKAYCWGRGTEGQLGNGTTPATSLVPVAVTSTGVLSGKTLTKIRSGLKSVCAIDSAGSMYCWGQNNYGQLGNGSTTNSSNPVAVPLTGLLAGKTILDVGVGTYSTCVLASDSNVYCWGFNTNGQLGNGSTTNSLTPVAVDTSGALSGKTVQIITSGPYNDYTCVRASDGQVYCWGLNPRGEFGNNTVSPSAVPVLTTHP